MNFGCNLHHQPQQNLHYNWWRGWALTHRSLAHHPSNDINLRVYWEATMLVSEQWAGEWGERVTMPMSEWAQVRRKKILEHISCHIREYVCVMWICILSHCEIFLNKAWNILPHGERSSMKTIIILWIVVFYLFKWCLWFTTLTWRGFDEWKPWKFDWVKDSKQTNLITNVKKYVYNINEFCYRTWMQFPITTWYDFLFWPTLEVML
jgi:hypothetical protein